MKNQKNLSCVSDSIYITQEKTHSKLERVKKYLLSFMIFHPFKYKKVIVGARTKLPVE